MVFTGPTISIGICLPLACAVDQLESNVNGIVHHKLQNMTMRIDKDVCQTKEISSDFKTIDSVPL